MTAAIDPFAPSLRADPYETYARLRDADPVHRSARGSWIVTRYDDVAALLADARMSHWQLPPAANASESAFDRIVGRWLSLMNPANRSRLRRITAPLFAASRIAVMRDDIERHAIALLDSIAGETMDVVADYADPLSLAVTAAQLGVPQARRGEFASIAIRLRGALFSLLVGGRVPAGSEEAARELTSMMQTLMSALHAAEEEDHLDRDDFGALALVFLFAGHENTSNFIATSVRTLLCNEAAGRRRASRRDGGAPQCSGTLASPPAGPAPSRRRSAADQWRSDPSLGDRAVEELLRFESPVQYVSLTAREPVELRGRRIEAGEEVLACLGAANRDPEVFEHPDELLLDRTPNPHLALGHGPFFCIGAAMARLEARVAIEVLLRRLDSFSLADDVPRWRDAPPVLRGLQSLPLHVVAAMAGER